MKRKSSKMSKFENLWWRFYFTSLIEGKTPKRLLSRFILSGRRRRASGDRNTRRTSWFPVETFELYKIAKRKGPSCIILPYGLIKIKLSSNELRSCFGSG